MSVCHATSPSVIPVCLSYNQSVHHPVNSSLTHQSVTPPISPTICPSDHLSLHDCLYDKPISLSDHPSPPDCLYDTPLSLSDHLSLHNCLYDQPLSLSDLLSPHNHLYDDPTSLSTCPSLSDCLTTTTTCPTIFPSSTMIQRTQDSSQSLAVMNGSNPVSISKSVGPLLTMTYFYMT